MLCAARLRSGGPGQQTDARLFLLALRLLLRAEVLASETVKAYAQPAQILAGAKKQFHDACPHAKEACDVVEHFAEYASGEGNLQGRRGTVRPDLARTFWPLGYDPHTDRITIGPYEVHVGVACEQAKLLQLAIWQAVRAFEDAGSVTPVP